MKRVMFKTLVLISILTISIFILSEKSNARLSKKQKEKLNELTQNTPILSPIYGKINTPLKLGVSVNEYVPETTYTKNVTIPKSTIALLPSGKKDLTSLKSSREELHTAEIEGLNFIQPSLTLTEEEQKAIDEFFTRNEQEQLLNLWRAAIERNKTVQFIIQKLTPANSTQQKKGILAKTVGAAIFLPFYALQALSDNAGAYYGGQVGGRVLGSLLDGRMGKNEAVMQLSQTETIVLFMMIDEVAERLRQRYYSYKRLMTERALASLELEETRKDNLAARESESPAASILADIQRRGAEREIRKLDADLRYYKNALVELAGPQAIGDLESQLKIELAATTNTPLDWSTEH